MKDKKSKNTDNSFELEPELVETTATRIFTFLGYLLCVVSCLIIEIFYIFHTGTGATTQIITKCFTGLFLMSALVALAFTLTSKYEKKAFRYLIPSIILFILSVMFLLYISLPSLLEIYR